MNKSSILFLCAVVAGFGAVIYFEERRATELEHAAETLRVNNDQLAEVGSRHREEIRHLHEQAEVFKKESEELRTQLTKAKSASPAGGQKAAGDAATAETGKEAKPASGAKNFMSGFAKMFTDPEMKKTMRVQQMVGIRMMYGDLAKELNLPSADAEQLLEILGDRQMDVSAAAMSKMAPDAPDTEKDGKKITDTQKRYEEQLKAVLGEDRYKQFQSYESTIGDRFMLQQSEGQFAAAGSPLEAAQKEKLLAVMREERANKSAAPGALNNVNPRQQMEQALNSDEAMNTFTTSQEDFNRRVMARARDLLNADQIAAFEKAQQQQMELIKMQVKMSRQMLGGSK
jgi:hypothetical protein